MKIPDQYATVIGAHLTNVPVKLGKLAADLGLEVFKSTLNPGISGLIEPSDTAKSRYRIRLNRFESTERQRFTLAHEISHFLLHRQDIGGGVIDDVLYRSGLSDRKEVEANKLASVLIMPDAAIHAARQKVSAFPVEDQIEQLASEFRVSQQAMRIKLGV